MKQPHKAEVRHQLVTTTPTGSVNRIRAANDKFGKHFSAWIQAVGGELRKAQELLASHKAGFEKWCKAEFGWGTSHVHQIINAKITFDVLTTSATVEVKRLPDNERQLRELSKLAEDDVPTVWQAVVEQAGGRVFSAPTRTATLRFACFSRRKHA